MRPDVETEIRSKFREIFSILKGGTEVAIPVKDAPPVEMVPPSPSKRTDTSADAMQVYAFILAHKIENQGNGPSFHEIAEAMGYGARTAVTPRLRALAAKGLIQLGKKNYASQIKVIGASFVPPPK